MKNSLPIRHLLLADVCLAAVMSAYWLRTGISQIAALAVFMSIFFAGCPLPYFLSAGIPIFRAARIAEKREIHLKSPKALRELQYIDTLVLNKNGTLTEGKPYISDIVPEGMSQSSLLAMAAAAERDATHPIGKALFHAALSRNLRLQQSTMSNEITGCGVEAMVNGKAIRVGRLKWLQDEKIDISAELLTKNDQLAYHGKMPVFVSNGNYARGIIALEDSIPRNVTAAIHRLQNFGIRVILITGDSHRTAAAIQKKTGIDDIRSDLFLRDKIRELQLMRAQGLSIAMVGNLEQDKEVFAEADLAIQLIPQRDTEIPLSRHRIELADPDEPEEEQGIPQKASVLPAAEDALQPDIVLQGGLRAMLPAIEIAREARSIIRQNHILTCLTWLLLLPPAMGLLKVFGGSFLDPDIAFGGFFLASIIILLNSLRMVG